jgi:hypothetical protein
MANSAMPFPVFDEEFSPITELGDYAFQEYMV